MVNVEDVDDRESFSTQFKMMTQRKACAFWHLPSKSMPAESMLSILYDDVGELVFLGLQGMMDPPRPEAIRAVQTCPQCWHSRQNDYG